jgi:hypothetical protein
MTNTMFAHSLLFECEACHRPVAISISSATRGLEAVDSTSFNVACQCGRTEKLMGVSARRHWVVTWPIHKYEVDMPDESLRDARFPSPAHGGDSPP